MQVLLDQYKESARELIELATKITSIQDMTENMPRLPYSHARDITLVALDSIIETLYILMKKE